MWDISIFKQYCDRMLDAHDNLKYTQATFIVKIFSNIKDMCAGTDSQIMALNQEIELRFFPYFE